MNQVEDVYNTKYEKLVPYKIAIYDLLIKFDKYIINNIPRINNTYTDVMVSTTSFMAIDIEDEEIILKIKIWACHPV